MKLLRERNRQQAVKLLAVCIFIMAVLAVLITFFIYKDYTKQVNLVITEIIFEVKEAYPDTAEETL